MKNQTTEIVFILDRSGSMQGLEADTIGGFNSTIKAQRNEEGAAFVTTVLFDNEVEILHDRIPLDQIEPMTEKQYFVRGCTALLDAIGQTISHIKSIHRYAREEDVPGKTLFIITTDGMENASREFTLSTVKKMIKQETKNGWEFIFLGANIDVVSTAEDLGIERKMAARFDASSEGVDKSFQIMEKAICCARKRKSIDLDSFKK